tara:strand:- start:8720 stop:9106 length:387 start_codon:yes stop_codon:yes gene_type:complete
MINETLAEEKPTHEDALTQLRENIKENNKPWGYRDQPTSIEFDGGKAYLSKCKNYIRVKTKYGTANYMLKRKVSRRVSQVDSISIYSNMKNAVLKEVCKSHGLKVSGTKAELVARIDAHMLTLVGEEE